jgi:hypothetical protein
MKINNVKTLITQTKKLHLVCNMTFAMLAAGSIYAQAPSTSAGPQESMRVSLYQLSAGGTTTLADGNLTNYDDGYSNEVGDDALKMNNFGENFAILRNTHKLAIEQRRKIYDADTTYFSMWNMQQRNYRLIITTYNLEHPGLQGFFVDNYLNTSTPLALNSQNLINFSVTSVAGSYAAERFRIVFKNPTLTPLSTLFTGFNGRLNGSKIDLQWNVNNEVAMREYVLERSLDRISFSALYRAAAANTGSARSYSSADADYFKGDNFYRIKAVGLAGDVQYSSILKINGGGQTQEILVYPNPVSDKKVNILITAVNSGKYQLNLYNSAGSRIVLPSMQVTAGQNSQTIELPVTLATGIYRLKITSPENVSVVKTINVL